MACYDVTSNTLLIITFLVCNEWVEKGMHKMHILVTQVNAVMKILSVRDGYYKNVILSVLHGNMAT